MTRLVTIFAAGFVCALFAVVVTIGNVTLIAHDELRPFIPALVGATLAAAATLPLATALLSTIGGQITTTQEIAVVAMISVTVQTTVAFAGDKTSGAYLATVIVTMGATTALCGVAMLALGAARLGRIIRFVPYPVFGGFLAITGWYLLTGGLETALGERLSLDLLSRVVTDPVVALKLGFAAAYVAFVMLFNGRVKSGALLPISIAVVAILFDLAVAIAGVPLNRLQASGWIITVPAGGVAWPPFGWGDVAAIDWHAVGQGLLFAPIVVLVTVAAAMMNVSGIEIETGNEVDLNRELKSMGLGNVISGFLGGIPGYPAVSATLIAVRMGTTSRWVGVVVAGVCLVAVAFAQQLLDAVPAPLLGALLIWVGVSLLYDWVIKPLRTLRRQEHAIILIILAVAIVAGFPAGIFTGLLAALVLFVFEYSRVEAIRFAATGRDYQSRLLPEAHRAVLEQIGGSIVIMKLSGFIFFGTSDRIVQQVAARAADTTEPARFVVMDFRRVTGIDASAMMSFDRLRRLAEDRHFIVILAGVGEALVQRLTTAGIDLEAPPLRRAPDLDAALAWAEQQLLAEHSVDAAAAVLPPLAQQLGSARLAEQLRPYCAQVTYAPGARIIEQGAAADDILFIASGSGEVVLESDAAPPVKLMGFGPGSILGEIAFYRGERRTASAVAESEITAFTLSREALGRVERDAPSLAAAFHAEIARALADRMQSANRLIQLLSD